MRAAKEHGNRGGGVLGGALPLGIIGVVLVGCTGLVVNGPGGAGDGEGVGAPAEGSGGAGDPTSGGGTGVGLGAPTAEECTHAAPSVTAARIWRLNDQQIANAVTDLLPGIARPSIRTPGRHAAEFVSLADQLPIGEAVVHDLRDAIKRAADEAVQSIGVVAPCAAGADARSCAAAFVDGFATRAFRRPLAASERTALLGVYATGAATGFAEGIRAVIEAVLQAPSFLYRTELGSEGAAGSPVALTPYELAASMSFLLLDSIPDAELFRAAQDGRLGTADGLAAEAGRLLASPRAQANLARVVAKWAGLGGGVTTELSPTRFPEYTAALRASMAEETNRFLSSLVRGGGTLADLLTSRSTFVDGGLAKVYGLPYQGQAFTQVTLPAAERAGILTQPAVVVEHSRGNLPVHRGLFINRVVLCGEIPPPPAGVNTQSIDTTGLSDREAVAARAANPVCGACHQYFDPLGLAYGRYDELGRYRATDARGAIDASGEVRGAGDADGPFASLVELSERLAGSREFAACFARQMQAYTFGRARDGVADRCEARRVADELARGSGSLRDLFRVIATAAEFSQRRIEP